MSQIYRVTITKISLAWKMKNFFPIYWLILAQEFQFVA